MQMRLSRGASQISLSGGYGSIMACTYLQASTPQDVEETTETVEIVLDGSRSAMLGDIRLIETWLADAERNQAERLVQDRIYLEWDVDDSGNWHRSEILAGSRVERGGAFRWLSAGASLFGLVITRRNFWEGSETQIPLSNGNGTNNTSGLNVYNCNDGAGSAPNKRNNYADIGAAAVSGVLPAPLRLEMTNQYNNSTPIDKIWIANNVYSDPANFAHMIEAESAAAGGSNSSASGTSGGQIRTFTWTGDAQVLIGRWVLSTAFLNRARGRWFKVLSRIYNTFGGGQRLQAKITFPSGTPTTVVGLSQEVPIDLYASITEIGTLQLPPWLVAASGDLAPVDLTLYARKPGGGSIQLDFLQVTPLDYLRQLIPRGYGASYQVRLVDDGIEGSLWTDGWTPAGKTGHYIALGSPIMVHPGKAQRLVFLQTGMFFNEADIDRVLNVKVFYRPRRWTL